ncbi:hypothetical protein ES707_12309 [subsurface metagenome]
MINKKFLTFKELLNEAQEKGFTLNTRSLQQIIYYDKIIAPPIKIEGQGDRNQRYFPAETLKKLIHILKMRGLWGWPKIRQFYQAPQRERLKMASELDLLKKEMVEASGDATAR